MNFYPRARAFRRHRAIVETQRAIVLEDARHVQAAAGSHVAVHTVTARFGAPYIADEASYAVASHAALDAWAAALAGNEPRPDAVLSAVPTKAPAAR